jgi:hypothetical protein
MTYQESIETLRQTPPPAIGRCSKCRTEILASHPYAWCTACNEPIPFGVNMQRRPIIYGTIKVSDASFPIAEIHAKQESQRGLKEAVRTFFNFVHK